MDVKGFLEQVAQQLTKNLGGVSCTIRILEDHKLKLIATYGVPMDQREPEISVINTIAGAAINASQLVINIENIEKDNRYGGPIAESDPKALAAILLPFQNKIVGVAQVRSREPFTPEQIKLAEVLGQAAGLAIGNNFFCKMTCRAITEIAELLIQYPLSFKQIPIRVAEKITEIVGVTRCTIYQIKKSNNKLYCEITAGVPPEEHGIGKIELLSSHPDINEAVETKQSYCITEPESDARTEHFREIIKNKNIKQIYYIVLEDVGVIVLDITPPKQALSVEELELCNWLGRLITLLIRHQANYQELRDLILNRSVSMGGFAERLIKDAQRIKEEAEKFDQLRVPYLSSNP